MSKILRIWITIPKYSSELCVKLVMHISNKDVGNTNTTTKWKKYRPSPWGGLERGNYNKIHSKCSLISRESSCNSNLLILEAASNCTDNVMQLAKEECSSIFSYQYLDCFHACQKEKMKRNKWRLWKLWNSYNRNRRLYLRKYNFYFYVVTFMLCMVFKKLDCSFLSKNLSFSKLGSQL